MVLKPHEKGDQEGCTGADQRAEEPAGAGALAGLGRLEAAAAAAGGRGAAPVERWDPPYCGDIGLSITRDGTWHYRGSPIRRMALVKLFASVLRRDADGRHYLVTPAEKVDVSVEDAPLLAVEMEVIGAGRAQVIVMRTNLDDVVRVGAVHSLRFAAASEGALKPYVLVRGRIEALVTRALTYDLADLFVEDAAGRTGVWSDGDFFAVPDLAGPDAV